MKSILTLVPLIVVLSLGNAYGQGTMYKKSGHFIGLLDFFNNHPFKDASGRIPHPLPASNGLSNTADKWYEENNIRVKGLLQSAALQVDWWTLLGELTENYEFQWVSSGAYEIAFTDPAGKPVGATISKSQLEKYPDLLKRFNALAPTSIDFEIKWQIGDQTDADREAFKKKYKLMGSIGSQMPHVKTNFTTVVKGDGLLFEPSGVKPFSAPAIRQGKGQAFLGLPSNYDPKKLSEIFAYFNISTGHSIQTFRVIKINWPVNEMKAIAERFMRYESGEREPTPKEQIAKADAANKNMTSYSKTDFWADAFEEEKVNVELIRIDVENRWKRVKGMLKLKIGNKIVDDILLENSAGPIFNYEKGSKEHTENDEVGRLNYGYDTYATDIRKHKRIVGTFETIENPEDYDDLYRKTELRIYDYKANVVYSKAHHKNEKFYENCISHRYFKGTPYILVAEWFMMSYLGRSWPRKVYFLNLTSLKEADVPLFKYKDHSEGAAQGIDMIDLSSTSPSELFGEAVNYPVVNWWAHGGYTPSVEIYNSLFIKYKSEYKYLIFIHAEHWWSEDEKYFSLYGISKDDQIVKLEDKHNY